MSKTSHAEHRTRGINGLSRSAAPTQRGTNLSDHGGGWDFFEISESSAGGGDLQRLLRGTNLSAADMLAREVIQNSWDAARKLRTILSADIPFRMDFVFRELTGADKENFVSLCHLRDLQSQKVKAAGAARVPECGLDSLDDDTPLRVLQISDYGAHGLYGDPSLKKKSVLFNAVYYMGGSRKDVGMGGSYGVGKSAFIRGSHARTAFIHSCFRPYPGESNASDPVTRRFLGFCWWTDHEIDGVDYDGRGRFVQLLQQGGSPRAHIVKTPFVDEVADVYARKAGLPLRDSQDDEELGTTLLLLDPSVSPHELLIGIVRNWWPALEENLMDLRVVDYEGNLHFPEPDAYEEMLPFVQCFRTLSGFSQPVEGGPQVLSGSWYGIAGRNSGSLAVVSVSEETAEFDEASDDILHQKGALVARYRGPRMVVDYLEWNKSLPFKVRGVYKASEDLDELLRETEPALHDQWTTTPQDDISPEATEAASAVRRKIVAALKDYVRTLTPPAPKKKSQLDRYSQILARFINDRRDTPPVPPRPPSPTEPVEFLYKRPAEPVAVESPGTGIRTEAAISLRVADKAAANALRVRVSCGLTILEDESPTAGSSHPVSIWPVNADGGFALIGDEWVGVLTKDEAVIFNLKSAPYDEGWSVYLAPRVEVVPDLGGDDE